ncbi:O-antigen ligase family protein [Haliscomenobacter sp.]|uniref:O-antigen ligase family protein n=1 Tax=Haliscomenobacter sp. TaxID=2717303 RepID=UPI0033651CD2
MKRSRLNYLLTFLFLLLAAKSNILSSSNLLWFVTLLSFFFVALKYNALTKKELRIFGGFSISFFAYILIRNVLFNSLPMPFLVSDVLFLFKFLFLSFLFVAILKHETSQNIVKVMTDLTFISFFFFAFQLIAGEAFFNLIIMLHLTPQDPPSEIFANCLVFTYTKELHDYRNSGFVWEPGGFGCFLIISLMLNLFINKFTFDRSSIILIIGVITTVSTTAYLALLILLLMVYRYKHRKVNFGVIFLIPILVLIVLKTPFIGEKIVDLYSSDMDNLENIEHLSHYYDDIEMQMRLNRFASITYIYDMFKHKLIFGISNMYDEVMNKVYSVNISNGIMDFMAKYGLVGFVYLMSCYARFCKKNVKYIECVVYCVLIMIVLGFGSPILTTPIALMFLFLPYYKFPELIYVLVKKPVQVNIEYSSVN